MEGQSRITAGKHDSQSQFQKPPKGVSDDFVLLFQNLFNPEARSKANTLEGRTRCGYLGVFVRAASLVAAVAPRHSVRSIVLDCAKLQ
jgi:hypothetical protein